MSKSTRVRIGCVLLILVVINLSFGSFWSTLYIQLYSLKVRLFDGPALEAKRQSVVPIILAFTANDVMIEESHYPIRKTDYCLWGRDTWMYKSNRTRSEIIRAFDLSFVGWEKWLGSTRDTTYNNGSLFVSIEWNADDANPANTYVIQLNINDPPTPLCTQD